MKILSLIAHAVIVPNPVRPSFIFGTQIKILFYEIQELSDPP